MASPAFKLTAPELAERDIHEACASALDRLLQPPAMWFCYPAGATQLSPQQMARYSRLGLKRGMPDLWLFHNGVYCIELKCRGGRLSKTRIARTRRGSPRVLIGQEDTFPQLLASGGVNDIRIAHSVDEMLHYLRFWEIPLRGRHLAFRAIPAKRAIELGERHLGGAVGMLQPVEAPAMQDLHPRPRRCGVPRHA